MQFTPELIAVLIISLLAIVLSLFAIFQFTRLARHYNSLTAGIDTKTLTNVLEGIQRALSQLDHTQELTKKELAALKEASRLNIQRVTLKRFNPFGDTGGDQSFILALLDGNSDGVVITSLHSRENTRFYVKSVKGGVGIDHPLSEEEQKIISRLGKKL